MWRAAQGPLPASSVGRPLEGAHDPEGEHGQHDERDHGQHVEAVLRHDAQRQEGEQADHGQRRDQRHLAHHHTGNRGGMSFWRFANARMSANPNTTPPMCAKYATPPPPGCEFVASTSCSRNQKPSTKSAGISTSVKKKMMKMTVSTFARG